MTLLSEVHIEKDANILQTISRRLGNHNLTTWAKNSWWSESFVQLAGLVQDSDWLARRIVDANPWLAWWCVQEGRDVPANTKEMIEARSIKLLQSQSIAERRRAVQTLAQIKNDRVLEPLLIAAGDGDKEIAGLGVRALVEIGDAVQLVARKVLQSDNKPGWRGSLRFLKTQSHYPYWAEIPAKVYEDALGESNDLSTGWRLPDGQR